MKEEIIALMKLFDYDFIEENPPKRLLFYDVNQEQTVQVWCNDSINHAVELIKNRLTDYGKYIGRTEVQSAIISALGLNREV